MFGDVFLVARADRTRRRSGSSSVAPLGVLTDPAATWLESVVAGYRASRPEMAANWSAPWQRSDPLPHLPPAAPKAPPARLGAMWLNACDVRPGDRVKIDGCWVSVEQVTTARCGADRQTGVAVYRYDRLDDVYVVPGRWGRPPEPPVALPPITYGQETE
jgi:hypothetical protein